MMLSPMLQPMLQPLMPAVFDFTFSGSLRGQVTALFANNEQGAWYDPSNMASLYQDNLGVIPVTAVGQMVGLMLDQRKGTALGPELVTNGTFDSGTTGWVTGTLAASAAAVNGEMQVTPSTDYGRRFFVISTVIGKSYRLSGTLRTVSGPGTAFIGYSTDTANGSTATSIAQTTSSTAVPATILFVATATSMAIVAGTNTSGTGVGSVFAFDNITCKLQDGNHASQATATARPLLQARVNLLTKTEQFDDGAWGKTNLSVTPNVMTAPDGTVTADKLVGSTVSNQQSINSADTPAGTYSYSAYAKAGELPRFAITAYNGSTYFLNALFDLTTGTVVMGIGARIENAGNGWYRCIVENLTTATGTQYGGIQLRPGKATATDGITGGPYNGTDGVYIWGAQIVVGAVAASYQRVNTATDYDGVGFPQYLDFDGAADWLSTPSIDFTATNKMTVFAGINTRSTTSTGMIAELSVTSDSNAGAFFMTGPSNAAGARMRSGGTSYTEAQTGGVVETGAANFIYTLLGDISAPSVIGRRNGTAFTNTATQGIGNYGNYPLYIGERGGASLPFGGRMYALIVRGAASSAAQISSGENYCNSKTKAY